MDGSCYCCCCANPQTIHFFHFILFFSSFLFGKVINLHVIWIEMNNIWRFVSFLFYFIWEEECLYVALSECMGVICWGSFIFLLWKKFNLIWKGGAAQIHRSPLEPQMTNTQATATCKTNNTSQQRQRQTSHQFIHKWLFTNGISRVNVMLCWVGPNLNTLHLRIT